MDLESDLRDCLDEDELRPMGYAMSRLEIDSEHCDGGKTRNEISNGQRSNKSLNNLDHEISLITKLKSRPHERLAQVTPGKREFPVSTIKMLAGREINGPWLIDQMTSRAYVSQFSADGSLFVAGFQGSHIRIYNVERGWKVQKNILAKSLRWTVTDTSLSSDQRHLVYASMSPIVHIVDVGSAATESLANITEIHDGLDFSADGDGGYSFGIFSVKFSTDGRELVAGSSDDSIYVYDIEQNKLSLQIHAHASDVNTVCFADESGHLIYSGSDDNLCKVWDRRCFIARGNPAGVLVGHLEGITFLDSRGDGRYFISNGKDQTIKLWDIRKMASNAPCDLALRNYEWDYRWMDYPPQAKDLKHPGDQSVAHIKVIQSCVLLFAATFPPHIALAKSIYTLALMILTFIYTWLLESKLQFSNTMNHLSEIVVGTRLSNACKLFLGRGCCEMGISYEWRSSNTCNQEEDSEATILLKEVGDTCKCNLLDIMK
ncbi:hypothetical protein GH714_024350 [Hevea brasiliensis]|uniref:Uncharacterized protein n=1 Tax=Hevea brasiliensis TaxID=3981 RepID=A0A6A6LG96_HEVBR|nr:hypothetical protein GH714_024350 [Hevea brasiliensis]